MGQPLKVSVDPLSFDSDQHRTIVIYWRPRSGPDALSNGHAALIIDTHKWLNFPAADGENITDADRAQKDNLDRLGRALSDTTWYVSWLGGAIDWHPRKGQKKGGAVGVPSRFQDDMDRWGTEKSQGLSDAMGSKMCWPTRWVAINGLNTQDMFDAWQAAKDKKSHWRLFDKNCATMVHTILKAGGGDGFATAHKKQLVWWPTDLIRYARSMTNHVYKSSGDP